MHGMLRCMRLTGMRCELCVLQIHYMKTGEASEPTVLLYMKQGR